MLKAIYALGVAGGAVGAVAAADHWSATLQPANGSTVAGTASVDALGPDSTRVTISVRGAPANASLPWHIHNGTCAAPGAVLGSDGGYPMLMTTAGGAGQAVAALPMKPPATGSFAIQVHRAPGAPPAMEDGKKADAAPSSDVLSCGNLKEVLNKVPDNH